jgi:hypothetical protein
MPFLTLKRVIIDDGWGNYPHVANYLILDHALERMRKEVQRLKDAGATFDSNSSPHLWEGTLPDGEKVSVQLKDEPFDDNSQLYCNDLSIYSR